MRKSNSIDDVSFMKRISYLWSLARMNATRTPPSAQEVINDIRRATHTYEHTTGKPASEARFLEIGFGARPHRAFAFQALVRDTLAVDLDKPIFGLRDFSNSMKTNGFYRAAKGTIRATIFDMGEWANFHKEMGVIYPNYDPDATRLVVADASDSAFWQANPGPYDFVYSTDVFEHIPPKNLVNLLEHLRQHLAPSGVILTRPTIFTGIIGGHDPSWYPHRLSTNNSETAWQHLWNPGFTVDTYLNRLTRRQYEDMFHAAGFTTLSETEVYGRLGEAHLTEEIRNRLAGRYDERELFSNTVEYVLAIEDGSLHS